MDAEKMSYQSLTKAANNSAGFHGRQGSSGTAANRGPTGLLQGHLNLSPANIHAERAVLGAILETSGEVLAGILTAGLCPGDFSLDFHRQTFATVCDLHKSDQPLDAVFIADELCRRYDLNLNDCCAYLADLVTGVLVDWGRIHKHASIIIRDSQRRQEIALGEWLMSFAAQADADPVNIAAVAMQTMQEIVAARHHGPF